MFLYIAALHAIDRRNKATVFTSAYHIASDDEDARLKLTVLLYDAFPVAYYEHQDLNFMAVGSDAIEAVYDSYS